MLIGTMIPQQITKIVNFGLFRQDKHWVVAEIYNADVSEGCDNQLEFDKVERITSLKTYMPNEEALARKEYESK